MDMIWKNWRISARELLLSLSVMLGGWVFGIVIVACIVKLSDADSYIVLGSFIALIMWMTTTVFVGATSFEKQFSMAVAMGRTRREAFLCRYIVQQVNILIGLAIIAGLDIIETALGRVLYRGLSCEFSIVGRFRSPYIVFIVAIVFPVIYVFFGMLLARFQKKALWGMWVAWMLACLLASNIERVLSDNPQGIFAEIARVILGIGEFIAAIGLYGQLAMVVVLCVLMLVIAWIVLRRQEVTQV